MKTVSEQINDYLKRRKPVNVCCVCGTDLDTHIDGFHNVPAGLFCNGCYYDALGNEIEKHPITSPRRR